MFSTGCYSNTHIRLVNRLRCSLNQTLIAFLPPFVELVSVKAPFICAMATKLFAVIVGIDKYKSGNIWDLETCVNDAQSVKRWLTHDLHVPRDQICLLTDKQATQRSIEDNFMKHLVNNPTIERGDSILFYFAGHGSSSRAPKGWFGHNSKTVEVLCPYDHDTKGPSGRVPGLSDRSLHAMMKDLSSAKGDNITLILDCSFQSPTSRVALRERRHCRWTPTTKASPDDLDAALWRSALGYSSKSPCRGFSGIACETHIVLTACRSGEGANESKAGGKFTQALLATKNAKPIHHMTYNDFMHHIENRLEEDQHPMCVGLRKHRTIFNGVPFMCDARYVPVTIYDEEKFRVDAGAIHGITEGTEFSFHKHNRQGSLNPVLATFSAAEVHPTWCLVRNRSTPKTTIDNGWARITRWNNRTPFRVHIRRSIFQFFRRLRLRRLIPAKTDAVQTRPGVNIVRVRDTSQADLSVKLRRHEVVLERHDALLASHARRIIELSSTQTSTDLKVIEAAARFHLHLHRRNPERPLLGMVTMELYRLDSSNWTRVSGNLIVDGRAQIVDDEKNSIYAVVLQNYSNYDLWPYLAYMDSTGYGISMVYHPDASHHKAPLRRHSHLVIGSGTTDSEALSFTLADDAQTGIGFLKLFVSSVFTPMNSIEQGPLSTATMFSPHSSKSIEKSSNYEIWDSLVACVTVVRKQ